MDSGVSSLEQASPFPPVVGFFPKPGRTTTATPTKCLYRFAIRLFDSFEIPKELDLREFLETVPHLPDSQ